MQTRWLRSPLILEVTLDIGPTQRHCHVWLLGHPFNPILQGLELQTHGCPLFTPFPTIRKGQETSLTGLAQLCTQLNNQHKTIGMDKQTQPSTNTPCHNTDEGRDNQHFLSFFANKTIIKATNSSMFTAVDITVSREPFEELITGPMQSILNYSTSPLLKDAVEVTSSAITTLFQMEILRPAAPVINQSQVIRFCGRFCDRHALTSRDTPASVQFSSCACAENRGCYAEHLLHVNKVVMAFGVPNRKGARLPLPSNLHFKEWQNISHTKEDDIIISYLKLGFPAGYEGQVPTLLTPTTTQLTNTVVMWPPT